MISYLLVVSLHCSLQLPNLSYYLKECFQHIYFATSTLWGEPGVLGNKENENFVRIPILQYVKMNIDSSVAIMTLCALP